MTDYIIDTDSIYAEQISNLEDVTINMTTDDTLYLGVVVVSEDISGFGLGSNPPTGTYPDSLKDRSLWRSSDEFNEHFTVPKASLRFSEIGEYEFIYTSVDNTELVTININVTAAPPIISVIDISAPEPKDSAPTSGSKLAVTSDGVYQAIQAKGVPDINTGDAGKVLQVNAGETGVEWAIPSSGVTQQYVDSADAATLASAKAYTDGEVADGVTEAKAYTDNEISGIDIPEYTAGAGISISGQNVISNTAQPDVTKSYVDGVDANLQQQIDAIVASSDVKDIVGTYAELQAYDTTTLGNNDIVKVLVDSTHNDAMGYYRWVITEGVGAWTYIGSEGPYYTKSQTDALLNDKLEDDFSGADVGQATAGQVLTVNSSANGVEFADVPKELPVIASGDAGKVLQVNSGETGVEWANLVTGGGYEYDTSTQTNATIGPYGRYTAGLAGYSLDYDYIIFAWINSTIVGVKSMHGSNSGTVYIALQNYDSQQVTVTLHLEVYKRHKVSSTNKLELIGTLPEATDGTTVSSLKAIPATSGNANKKLGVNASGKLEFQTVNEVPAPTASDANKVLTATGANAFSWVTPSGGSGNDPILNAIKIDSNGNPPVSSLVGCIIMGEFPNFTDFMDIECQNDYVDSSDYNTLYSRYYKGVVTPCIITSISQDSTNVRFVHYNEDTGEYDLIGEQTIITYSYSGINLITGQQISNTIAQIPAQHSWSTLINLICKPDSDWYKDGY